MAVPALKQAMETFAAVPQPPTDFAPGGVSQRQDIVRQTKKFVDDVAQWQAGMIQVQQSLTKMYRDVAELATKQPEARALLDVSVRGIEEFIRVVDESIETERRAIDESELSDRQVVATMMKKSQDNAHFMRKILKKLRDAGISQHNTRVNFYYFLLALRAEYDPESRGGPKFTDPVALERHLRGERNV
jgi:hypothetical protein